MTFIYSAAPWKYRKFFLHNDHFKEVLRWGGGEGWGCEVWPDLANFSPVGQKFKSCAIFPGFIQYLAKFCINFGKFWCLGKFSLLQMTKYWKTDQTVWSHWRLGSKTCVPCKRWFANLNVTSRVRRRRRLVKRLSTFLSHFSHFWLHLHCRFVLAFLTVKSPFKILGTCVLIPANQEKAI